MNRNQLIIRRHQCNPSIRHCNMADHIDTQCKNLLLFCQRHCKKQFKIVPPVQCCHYRIRMQLFGHPIGLLGNRQTIQIDPCTFIGIFTQMQNFRRQTIGNVNHRSWNQIGFSQFLNDIQSGRGSQLTPQNIFVTLEFGMWIGMACQCSFFTLQQMQAHIGTT